MKKRNIYIVLFYFAALSSCKHKETSITTEAETTETEVQTPVTVTTISNAPLEEYVELNATSTFLQDNIVKSNINGYIKAVNIKLGQYASAGRNLFILKTKEAESLGNTINSLDKSLHFSGIVNIAASQSGFITQLDHQPGDYVQDGEQLAVISNSKSFGFVLNIPYEYRQYISIGKAVKVDLPDGTHLTGSIASFMPALDSASQTQGAMIKVNNATAIPENLIARVKILKAFKPSAISLPKSTVLTDEAQTSFWIMKMIDSVTAVKTLITKGMETADMVEIIYPVLSPADKILNAGNYGLPDTARVKIVKSLE
ncbi:MAG: efflux RND transporter periplasmic adaptor subunit [Ferruginibacter sp.]